MPIFLQVSPACEYARQIVNFLYLQSVGSGRNAKSVAKHAALVLKYKNTTASAQEAIVNCFFRRDDRYVIIIIYSHKNKNTQDTEVALQAKIN